MNQANTAYTGDGHFQCTRPSYPDHYAYRDDHIQRTGSPVFAEYPLRRSRLKDGLTPTCTGGGFWHTDYLTGDEYYSFAPGEKCTFSCDNPLFKIEGKGEIVCDDIGELSSNQFKEEFPKCQPNYCIFPSFGHWFDGKISGVKVQMGVECPGDYNRVS